MSTIDEITAPPVRLAFTTAEAFAAVDEKGAEPLVVAIGSDEKLRAVIPSGGLVLVYGDGGVGKTTLLLDLAAHLASGMRWCGTLEPVRPLRIAWIENEGPRPMMRVKIAGKLAAWNGDPIAGRILVLEEPWAAFTFRRDDLRRQLTAALDEHEIDLLIAGPLGRLGMEGAGTTDEIREFLQLVDAALGACHTRPAFTLVHHENRAGLPSGAWEREPDTLIHVQGQGHGRTRVHWQKVRWGSFLHGKSTQLVWADGEGFSVDERPDATPETMADEILEAARQFPGGSWTAIRKQVRGNASEAAVVRDKLLATGRLVNTAGREGYFNLALPDTTDATRSEPGTALERRTVPATDGATEPSRSTVPPFYRNGELERNGTDDPWPHIDEHELDRLEQLAANEGLA